MNKFLAVTRHKLDNESVETNTSENQSQVEKKIEKLFELFCSKAKCDPEAPVLYKQNHINYIKNHMFTLPENYECLDSSRPWLCYWLCQSLALLNCKLSISEKSDVVSFLSKCQHESGGFCGGPNQMPHLAPTYAAVCALCLIGTEEAYAVINRENLYKFLISLRLPNGSFRMHKYGECDVRAVYCSATVARLTNIYTDSLFESSAQWVIRCQTYEGGFGGVPGVEAHGGYTFCGFSALLLLKSIHMCDTKSLLRWVANKQMSYEGGFQGRTNKLVDGCYSFWQAAIFPVISELLESENQRPMWSMYDYQALQEYVLICCQNRYSGGLIDKPGKPPDVYHTCYVLSGLSIAQHAVENSSCVIGKPENILNKNNPIYNIEESCLQKALKYFSMTEPIKYF
ncbi:protein farnesyltransferase subunit beta [Rhopalosiphum maidis]|uniref:protein farnesyltransferase subunit beta n=1 Tax=Rhopalosiphum maidis TaxID=43146 RepID=UPI000F00E133|nr:protein farnesyltransferase subunit beta [Rhopalosiphum maidis]XP_026822061.1 protein farnesyltransferase subunit beta [Rhopalosiphum maidis]